MSERMTITRESFEQLRKIVEAMAQGIDSGVVVDPAEPNIKPVVQGTDASFAFDDYGRFYDWLRSNKMLGPTITKSEFEGCDKIIRACAIAGWPISWVAYALATAYHETAHTMQPIKERGGPDYFKRMYDIQGSRPAKARELGNLTPGDGAKYAGRGYPQTTGKANYEKATRKLRAMGFDVDLVADPDRMLEPDIAAATMVSGMQEGWFTGRKLSDDLPGSGKALFPHFVASRDIINGKDRQEDIAEYAMNFQSALASGQYLISG